MRRCILFVTLLLMYGRTVWSTLNVDYNALDPNTYCAYNQNNIAYRAYRARRGPLPPVRVEANGDLSISYPATDPSTYRLEGVLSDDITGACHYCPYSEPPQVVLEEYVPSSGIRNLPNPMYGPCFDGQPSVLNRMGCVQNMALFPPDYCGEYFFPNQKLNTHISSAVLSGGMWNPNFNHYYVEDTTSATGVSNIDALSQNIDPSLYALGKKNVLNKLSGLIVSYPNSTNSNVLQLPYLYDDATRTENWPRWAQHFCRVSCHRDSMLAVAMPVLTDFQGQPLRFFLSRVGATNSRLQYIRCLKCPAYQASYGQSYTNGDYTMADPRDQGFNFNGQCFPWFGSLPTIALSNSDGQYHFAGETQQAHYQATDGIYVPARTYTQVSVPCPTNTYNDRCAHYFILNGIANPQCKTCPVGYHTNGQTGAWFCLPPAGKTAQLLPGSSTMESPLRDALNLFVNATSNQSLAWARRDLLAYEWECGALPKHCYQCSDATGTQGLTPDQFNQKMIVDPLFVWDDCPEGYYCPTALAPPIPCPQALPWSPPGSASIYACACLAGTYRNGTGVCVVCPTAATKGCKDGEYLRGSVACWSLNGASSGGECAACANKPYNAAYTPGTGREITTSTVGVYAGVCAFVCPLFTSYVGPAFGCFTATQPTCKNVDALVNKNGVSIYSAALRNLTDSFLISGSACSAVLTLSTRLNAYRASTTGPYAYVSTQCPSQFSYVVRPATFYSDLECALCPPPPTNGQNIDALMAMQCDVQCDSGYYFNETDRSCRLCASLDAMCNARNGVQTGYYIRGSGCYGKSEPFATPNNLPTLLDVGCVKCAHSVTDCLANEYLDLTTTPCACKSCYYVTDSTFGVTKYLSVQCGGTSPPVIADCTTSCPKNSWLLGKCSRNTTGVCTNCTRFKPGFRRDSECGSAVDAQWTPCGVNAATGAFTPGFYCDGSGAQAPCPNNLTSDPYASNADNHCYCPAGTVATDQHACNPIQCDDAVRALVAPGAGWRSASYMTLKEDHSTTICVPCGATSFSLGDGVGPASCVCPNNAYRDGGSCAPCFATGCGSEGPYLGVPDTCAAGFDTSAPACVCLRPPFMSASDTCSTSACNAGFELVPSTIASPGHTLASGSPLFASKPNGGWEVAYDGPAQRRIQDLVVTSNLNGWGAVNHMQYALWTLQGGVDYNVYAMPISGPTIANYDPYASANLVWTATHITDLNQCALQALAVAQWATPQTLSADNAGVVSDVGLIVWDAAAKAGGPSLYLYLNGIELGYLGTPQWTQGSLQHTIIDLNTPINAKAIALAHAYMPPGGSASVLTEVRSTFYVAVANGNVSLMLAVSPSSGSVLSTLSLPYMMDAMTLMQRADGVNLYLARGDRIQLVEWITPSPTVVLSGADELFLPSNGRAVALTAILWPSTSPIFPLFFALTPMPSDPIRYRNAGRPRRRLLVADMVQRTFVSLQGIHPFTAPVALGVTGQGQGAALLVAASEGTLFRLPATACISMPGDIPLYWDGAACQKAACVRSRNCLAAAGQIWDPIAIRCVCRPGYWGLNGVCTACVASQYCPGNTASYSLCPTTLTSLPRAVALSDCFCQANRYYDPNTRQCVACPTGEWCPNGWNHLPCPGTGTSSTGGVSLPNVCSCAAGFTGVDCKPCPSGFICPQANIDVMRNLALSISLPPNTGSTACSVFYDTLASLFHFSVDYLQRSESLAHRLLCVYVPTPPNRTAINDTVVLMVLINFGDQYNSAFNNMVSYLSTTSNVSILSFSPAMGPSPYTIYNNTPSACAAGYAPSTEATKCVCAPGFTSSGGSSCAACPAGQYKTKLDAGQCDNCPIGTTSYAGSSACIAFNQQGGKNTDTAGNATNANANTNTNNIIIITASVGGGVLLVSLLVWGIVAFSPS